MPPSYFSAPEALARSAAGLVQDDPGVAAAFRDALTGSSASSVVDSPLLQ